MGVHPMHMCVMLSLGVCVLVIFLLVFLFLLALLFVVVKGFRERKLSERKRSRVV